MWKLNFSSQTMDPAGTHTNCDVHNETSETINSCVISSEDAIPENGSTKYGSEPGIVSGGKTHEKNRQENEMLLKQRRGWRKIVRNFTPS